MTKNNFTLTQDELKAIGRQIIVEETAMLKPADTPLFFLVAAQPGSGKTEIISLLKRELDKNLLICNVDDFRDRHPEHITILREHETVYPELTWQCATYWNTMLKEYGLAQHFNILIETTLQDFGHIGGV